MKRTAHRVPALLALASSVLAIPAAAPAQEERTFQQLVQEAGALFQAMQRQLDLRQKELERLAEVLERLGEASTSLYRDPPMTRRDTALAAVEEARALAAQEPALDENVLAILDRCEAEAGRDVTGERGPEAAARLLAASILLEAETNDRVRSFLADADALGRASDGIAMRARFLSSQATRALDRLLALRAVALSERDRRQ